MVHTYYCLQNSGHCNSSDFKLLSLVEIRIGNRLIQYTKENIEEGYMGFETARAKISGDRGLAR